MDLVAHMTEHIVGVVVIALVAVSTVLLTGRSCGGSRSATGTGSVTALDVHAVTAIAFRAVFGVLLPGGGCGSARGTVRIGSSTARAGGGPVGGGGSARTSICGVRSSRRAVRAGHGIAWIDGIAVRVRNRTIRASSRTARAGSSSIRAGDDIARAGRGTALEGSGTVRGSRATRAGRNTARRDSRRLCGQHGALGHNLASLHFSEVYCLGPRESFSPVLLVQGKRGFLVRAASLALGAP